MQKQTQVYLDNAATTPVLDEVLAAMEPYWSRIFGNASSPYAVSRAARGAVDAARASVAELIGAQPDEVVFTSGGTEANNWALLGTALARFERRGHVLVSSIEHHAVLEPAETLRDLGYQVEHIAVDADGLVSVDQLADQLRADTMLVSLMAVNNETGVIQPLAKVGALCCERGVTLHSDSVQAAGKVALDVERLGVDLMTLSAHKFGGPKGVGVLYIKRGVSMRSMQRGGAQERGRRAGTENVPAIVGMGAAAGLARLGLESNASRLEALRQRLERGLAKVPGAGIVAAGASRAPHITNLMLAGRRAESLALGLDLRGIAVGTGSACASGSLEPSHVLAAMGHSREAAKSALRISLGVQNTEADVDALLVALTELTN